MLTTELLKQQTELQGLTDEQMTAIATLSQNDEDVVIGKRIGELYRQLDDTIEKSTGVHRNGDEKTYLYLERAAKELQGKAGKADEYAKQVAELTKEKSRLEKVIADGGADGETKKLLSQAQKDLADVTKQYVSLKADYDKQGEKHAAEIIGIRIDNELALAQTGIQFKKDLPKAVTDVLLKQAVAKVKAMNPQYVDDGKGGKVLAFLGEDGAIRRNAENGLKPFTAQELVLADLKAMGVIYEGVKRTGTGTIPPASKTGTKDEPINISGARTQTEATDIITDMLLKRGMVNGSREFQENFNKAWEDNNIKALPFQ